MQAAVAVSNSYIKRRKLMKQQGILTVVSGFSGAGKGTVMKELLARHDNYALSVSATTRSPRAGEEDGREYFFKTEEEFERMIGEDALLEYARYVDHSYGTPRAYVEEKLAAGQDVILEIEIQGALQIKEKFPEAVLVFLVPPTIEELKNRLAGRGSESEKVIKKRLSRAAEEAKGMDRYDYIVLNDTVDECADRLHGLIQSQHMRVSANLELMARMKKELAELAGCGA